MSRRLFCRCWILLLLFIGTARISLAQLPAKASAGVSKLSSSTAQELVRQALVNYDVRKGKTRDYTWLEYWMSRRHFREGAMRRSDAYELILVGTGLYKRHFLHNDQPLPEQEERIEKEKLQAAIHKSQEEGIKLRPIESKDRQEPASVSTEVDPQVREVETATLARRKMLDNLVGRAGPDEPILVTGDWFKTGLQDLELPLAELPEGFSLNLKGVEILEGRETYVITAIPQVVNDTSTHSPTATPHNFEMTLWIDRLDMEFVKVEAKAIRLGVISPHPEYSDLDAQNYSSKALEKVKESMADDRMEYSRGTVVREKWAKVNNELWLPKQFSIKGKEVWEHSATDQTGQLVHLSDSVPLEHTRTYLRYQKFRVGTRILPVAPQ